jgi:hypothetical protein
MPARRGVAARQWLAPAPKGRSRAAPVRTALSDISIDLALAVRNCNDDEDELAQLVEEVREARERLTRLITAVRAERAGWDDREEQWETWRSQLRNPRRQPARRDVH